LAWPWQPREALEMPRQPGFRIRAVDGVLHVRGEQRRFLVGAKEADRIEIPSLLVAADVTQEVLAAGAVRQPGRRDRRDSAKRARAIPIERDHPRVRQIALVAAKQLVAAVAG